MKSKKIMILSLIISIILIGIFSIIVSRNGIIIREKKIIKEMTQSELETSLNSTINQLNQTQELYAANVDAYKKKITDAITNQGVATAMNSSADEVAANIGKILSAKTEATATAAQILDGRTAWVNGTKITGTMVHRGELGGTLNAGESFQVPPGYTTGGTITANSLASQTQANATAEDILEGETAWVNGINIIGTMVNQGELNWSPTGSETYTLPAGYYSGGTLSTENAYNEGIDIQTFQTKNVSDANTKSFKISYTGNYLLVIISPGYICYNLTISGVNSKSALVTISGDNNSAGAAVYKINATAGQTLKVKNGRYSEGCDSGTQKWYLCKY